MAFVDKNSSAGWRVKSRRVGIFGGALLAVALFNRPGGRNRWR